MRISSSLIYFFDLPLLEDVTDDDAAAVVDVVVVFDGEEEDKGEDQLKKPPVRFLLSLLSLLLLFFLSSLTLSSLSCGFVETFISVFYACSFAEEVGETIASIRSMHKTKLASVRASHIHSIRVLMSSITI